MTSVTVEGARSYASPAREIGFWTAVALVMGNMIGSGVFLLPASLAAYGGLAIAGWLISATGSVLLAMVFARLARRDPAAGGPYAFTRQAFGDLTGFLVAWGYWISTWSTNAALAVAFVGYLDPFVPSIVRSPARAALLAIATVWVVTVVNIRSVKDAGRLQVVTTTLKILPLVLIGIAGLAAFEPSDFAIPPAVAATAGSSLMAVITLTLWAFLGLECATIPAGSVRNPHRTIPRATVVGTLLAAAIYILSTTGVMAIIPAAQLATTTAPFADAARALFGDTVAKFIAVGAAISCFGALNGWVLVVGQLPMAAAADGLFPRSFGTLSGRGTPALGMLISAGLSSALVAMNYAGGLVALFTFIILLATLSTLVPYVVCSLAWFVNHEGRVDRSTSGGRVVAALALLYGLVAIAGAGLDVIGWGLGLLACGVPVYAWMKRVQRRSGA
jgi:APA family basic amino acid/polyamine antiporter